MPIFTASPLIVALGLMALTLFALEGNADVARMTGIDATHWLTHPQALLLVVLASCVPVRGMFRPLVKIALFAGFGALILLRTMGAYSAWANQIPLHPGVFWVHADILEMPDTPQSDQTHLRTAAVLYPLKGQKPIKAYLNANLSTKHADALYGTFAPTRLLLKVKVDAPKDAPDFPMRRYLATRHLSAQATILEVGEVIEVGKPGRILQMRQSLRAHFMNLPQTSGNAVVLSLLTGDRALLDTDTKRLYQDMGTMHLLAISGAHVLFLAYVLAALVTHATDKVPFLYQHISRTSIRYGVMCLGALGYALFSGMEVPALRTVVFVFVLFVSHLLLLPRRTLSPLVLCAFLLAWFDPLVLWQAGFWLSFVATFLVMQVENAPNASYFERFWTLCKLQTLLFFGLFGLTLWLFGRLGVWGLVTNLVLVPLFGGVLVPANLVAGILYPLAPALSDAIWHKLGLVLDAVHLVLYALQGANLPMIESKVSAVFALLSFLGTLPFFLRHGVLSRAQGVVWVLFCIGFVFMQTPLTPKFRTYAYKDMRAVLIGRDLMVQSSKAFDADALRNALHRWRITHLELVVLQTPNTKTQADLQALATDFGAVYWGNCQAGAQRGRWIAQTGAGTGDIEADGCALLGEYEGQRVLVDPSAHSPLIWQIHALMCQEPPKADVVIASSGSTLKATSGEWVWLEHETSANREKRAILQGS